MLLLLDLMYPPGTQPSCSLRRQPRHRLGSRNLLVFPGIWTVLLHPSQRGFQIVTQARGTPPPGSYLKRSWSAAFSKERGGTPEEKEQVRQQRESLPVPLLEMSGNVGTVTWTLFLFLLAPGWVRIALQHLCLPAGHCGFLL